MAKKRSPALDYAVYLAVRAGMAIVQALPLSAARGLAGGVAWALYHLDRRHRLIALDNLDQAYPGRWTITERQQVVRAVYRHFVGVLIEIAVLPRKLRAHNWRRSFDLSEAHPVIEALLDPRPLLVVTGHFGNWEMAGFMLGLLGFKTFAIARTLDNPHLDRLMRQFREKNGQGILAKKDDFDRIRAVLEHGGVLATLADQDAGQRGVFVDYFGRPASTHKAIALMAIEYDVRLVVATCRKVGEPYRYKLEIGAVIDPRDYADHPDPITALTQDYTSAFERLVRPHPEQYLWLHRRWKHQPIARKARPSIRDAAAAG